MPQDKLWTHQDQLDKCPTLGIPKAPRKKDLKRRRNWINSMLRNPALPSRMYIVLIAPSNGA